MLVNAIYFRGDWLLPCDTLCTKPAPFHLAGDRQVDAPMMFQKGKFRYLEAEGGVQVLELPFAGMELSKALLLPPAGEALAGLE